MDAHELIGRVGSLRERNTIKLVEDSRGQSVRVKTWSETIGNTMHVVTGQDPLSRAEHRDQASERR